ncbi:ribonuclease H-like domain-containing protein, partial [Tanacetum coccineum]
MAEGDEDKTAFFVGEGVFCYRKMPFGLKNAGATYQRLVDKVFSKQIGRNLKAYVDDMVIKSTSEEGMLSDIQETFERFLSINMKLNPKKCSFGVEEGPFLGHLITKQVLQAQSLESNFNWLQKIVSQLAILGENISQEDLNLNFLRSLSSEWNTYVVVWRNKPDLDTMSFDLYNNFKIVEQEVKGTANSSSSLSNIANIQVSPASTQVSTASTQVSTANLNDLEEIDLKWQLALLSMRTRMFFQKTGRKITINGSDTAGYDKSKNQDSSRRTVNVEDTSSKAMLAINGAGFDWSYMADDEVPTNMALMAFSDFE